ncbi:uncharacterized protein M421DRAFT_418268 [Didymella exigua CBS 183.55]|uniref:Uncharacterized protein n=1 Tax=Didymella exigua CBS 183.55 TaxID=1150837 RepID=A0A6A5RZV2_9PLEO|nr:uncharacterized protein M421DRAFT_418268 [Didymella exigua CBS 183.55]KAF1930787.1 hypothetical protein M421DRAFT_418268 [Didymella exigua CBS 183.55]
MDPWRSPALQNAKLRAILSSYRNPSSTDPREHIEESDMSAPPAYHMVVDPEAQTCSMSSYESEAEEREDSEDETPEITINAATQIRGNGNIVSIAQMESVRIANLVATILSGDTIPSDPTAPQTPPIPSPPQGPVTNPSMSRTKGRRGGLNVNITVNCGATIIGDRNIVGPGLGDIARQMQLAQRNTALQVHTQQQQAKVFRQQTLAQGLAQIQAQKQEQKQAQMNLQHSLERGEGLKQGHQNLYQSQAGLVTTGGITRQATPPMSRSESEGSDGSPKGKRKAEDDAGEGLLMLKRC